MGVEGHGITFRKTASGRRWTYACECGWNSPLVHANGNTQERRTYATEAVCVGAAVKHVRFELRKTDARTLAVDGIRTPHRVTA